MRKRLIQPLSGTALFAICALGLVGGQGCAAAPGADSVDVQSDDPAIDVHGKGKEPPPPGYPQTFYHGFVGSTASVFLAHGGVPSSWTGCTALQQDLSTWNSAGPYAAVTPGGLATRGSHYGVDLTLTITNNAAFAQKVETDIVACAGGGDGFMTLSGGNIVIDPDIAQLSAALQGAQTGAAAVNEDQVSVTAYNLPSTVSNATIANAVRAAAAATSPHTVPCATSAVAAGHWVYGTAVVSGGSTSNWVSCVCPTGTACSGTSP